MSHQPEPIHSEPAIHPVAPDSGRPNGGKGMWAAILGALALAGGKLKFLAVFLKLGWLAKFWVTGGTMLLSVLAYATVQPLPFAIGFVLLIFIHEMGHAVYLQHYGLKATAPVFIPFVGAMIGMKEMPLNVEQEAWMAFGGPFFGGVAALVCFWIFRMNGDLLYLHLAQVGFVMNLFNLIPFHPLDGGRMTSAISKWFMVLGLVLVGGLMVMGNLNPVLILIMVLGIGKVFSLFRRTTEEEARYLDIPASARINITLAYFGLVFAWGWFGYHTYQMLPHT